MVKENCTQQIKFFSHVLRLPENSPAQRAIRESLRPVKKPVGRPKTTLLSLITKQLKDLGIPDLETARYFASYRSIWNAIIPISNHKDVIYTDEGEIKISDLPVGDPDDPDLVPVVTIDRLCFQ